MTYARDPVSVAMDPIAADLLERAWRDRPHPVSIYLAQPDAEWQRWAAGAGMGPLAGPDPVRGGRYHSRWGRAMARSLYHLHRHYMTSHGLDLADAPRPAPLRPPYALTVTISRLTIVPPGRPAREVTVRILSRRGVGRAVAGIPRRRRWNVGGYPGPATSDWSYHDE